ncbi:PilZ domain-containing protein [Phenylobacterium terrae]|uniref:PilZ domain-containing protein n=1 Tax=Phenylobacterium terrae TaxID=2665495 RepID=A0ABW4N559_9CAUL
MTEPAIARSAMTDSFPIERRSEVREPTNIRARICYGENFGAWADCIIKNLSKSGAMLEVAAVYPIPQTFTLIHIPGGVAFTANIKWRRGDLCGVFMKDRTELKLIPASEPNKIRDIWAALAT